MKHILVYGDSLSWGIIPNTRQRLAFDRRWPGVMESELLASGSQVRVIEDCLNGRRTVWEDPFKPGRNGLAGIEQRIEINSPLSLVILMLGINDFQSMHQLNSWHSAQGIAALVRAIRQAPVEPGMPVPPILIVTPPQAGEAKANMAPKFEAAREKSAGLGEASGRWPVKWAALSWMPVCWSPRARWMAFTLMLISMWFLAAKLRGWWQV